MGKKSRRAKERRQSGEPPTPRIDLNLDEVTAILERAKGALSPEDHAKLKAVMDTFGFIAR